MNMDAAGLIGMDTFENGQVTFRPGPVYSARKTAALGFWMRSAWRRNEALAVLHATLDFRRAIDVPGYERVEGGSRRPVYRHHELRLCRHTELNEALTSRFVVIQMPAIDDSGLGAFWGGIPHAGKEVPGTVCAAVSGSAKKCENAEISSKALDLRGLLDALRLIRRGVSAGMALDMGITNKAFDSYEQGLIRDVIAARIPANWIAAVCSRIDMESKLQRPAAPGHQSGVDSLWGLSVLSRSFWQCSLTASRIST